MSGGSTAHFWIQSWYGFRFDSLVNRTCLGDCLQEFMLSFYSAGYSDHWKRPAWVFLYLCILSVECLLNFLTVTVDLDFNIHLLLSELHSWDLEWIISPSSMGKMPELTDGIRYREISHSQPTSVHKPKTEFPLFVVKKSVSGWWKELPLKMCENIDHNQ